MGTIMGKEFFAYNSSNVRLTGRWYPDAVRGAAVTTTTGVAVTDAGTDSRILAE